MKLNPIYLLLLLVLLFACNSEKKYAARYVAYYPYPAILLIEPAPVQIKFYPPQGNSSSETFARRYFPYRMYDFINKGTGEFNQIMATQMDTSLLIKGYKVYSDTSATDFLTFPGQRYILEIEQFNAEEYVRQVVDSVVTPYGNQYFDTLISQVQFHVWLRLNPVDDTTLAAPLLYAGLNLEDYFKGGWKFISSSEGYGYSYVHMPIYAEDVLAFIPIFTDLLSDYIYDYFMNMNIYQRSKGNAKKYYTYSNGRIYPAGDARFVFMGE
ncbi:MAG: hypothetical protein JXR53_10915 [Bacteroidales bacterium]|nr:hypothetical protein [Bacteroidales bacterium]